MNVWKLNIQKILVSLLNFFLSVSIFFNVRRGILNFLGMTVGSKTTVHRGVKLFCLNGLSIGNNSTINYGCYLDARGGLSIGDNVNISHCVKIYTMSHDINHPHARVTRKAVDIKSDVWIFPNVLVMPGVIINEGAVVYPGSVVAKNLDPYTIYAGNPAKAVGKRKSDIGYSSEYPIWFGV